VRRGREKKFFCFIPSWLSGFRISQEFSGVFQQAGNELFRSQRAGNFELGGIEIRTSR
jgi:hypothetical protein